MQTINWGMIGCGNVTETKSGPAFYKSNGSALIGVMSRHILNAKDYAHRHQVPFYTDNAHTLITHPDIDAVYIATPVKFHAPYAIEALNAGKDVYLEKPMALNYTECIQIKNAALQNNSRLFVAYYRRSIEYFRKIKQLIDHGEIGKIISIAIILKKTPSAEDLNKDKLPWRVLPELSGGGYFHDLACHQIDILQYIAGPISGATGVSENRGGLYPADDNVFAELYFSSGVKATGNWNFVCNENEVEDRILITGSNGSIEFSTFTFSPIIVTANSKSSKYSFNRLEHVQQPFIQSVIDELRGIRRSDADLDSAIHTSLIMDKIVQKRV